MHGLRTRAALVAAVAALGVAAPGTLAGAAPAPSSALLAGVNIGAVGHYGAAAEADRVVAAASALHVKLLRADFPWSALEPRQGESDAAAYAYADRLVGDAAAAGIRVSATVASTPCWASSAPPSVLAACVPGHVARASSYPPRDNGAYAAFVASLAQRYGSRLAAIEIWNEPDQANEDYFAGPAKVTRYAALLRAAYPAIKRVAPSLPVLGGSIVGANGQFLRALYGAGIRGFYDGLSVHFYTLTVASVRAIHEIQLAYHDTRPLWLDEFGWPSCWPHRRIEQEQACVTPAVQAANVRDVVRQLASLQYVAAAVVYKLYDSRGEDFGALTAAGARKPSWAALAGALSAPLGPVDPVALRLSHSRGAIVASGSAPVGDFMFLEAFRGATLRYRAVFTLDRFDRYSLRLPAVLGAHGLTVRVYQYGAGPGAATVRGI